jgi:hypothetical protein
MLLIRDADGEQPNITLCSCVSVVNPTRPAFYESLIHFVVHAKALLQNLLIRLCSIELSALVTDYHDGFGHWLSLSARLATVRQKKRIRP